MVDEIGGQLAVIVVNYGSSALLAANLLPFAESLPEARVVVVDNRTTDEERATVSALAARHGWALVAPDDNPGFGSGMNLGVARALADGAGYLLLLNPDARIDAATARSLLDRAVGAPGDLHSPRIVTPAGATWFAGADLHLGDGRLRRPGRPSPDGRVEPWLSGACLLLTRDLWEAVGGFDDDYFLYWEDVDLSHRVLAAGGELRVWDELEVVHDEGGTHGGERRGRAKSDIYYFHVIRNRHLFAAKHLSDADLAAWEANRVRVAWEVLMQGGRRQVLTSPRVLLVAARALAVGRRMARSLRPAPRRPAVPRLTREA